MDSWYDSQFENRSYILCSPLIGRNKELSWSTRLHFLVNTWINYCEIQILTWWLVCLSFFYWLSWFDFSINWKVILRSHDTLPFKLTEVMQGYIILFIICEQNLMKHKDTLLQQWLGSSVWCGYGAWIPGSHIFMLRSGNLSQKWSTVHLHEKVKVAIDTI